MDTLRLFVPATLDLPQKPDSLSKSEYDVHGYFPLSPWALLWVFSRCPHCGHRCLSFDQRGLCLWPSGATWLMIGQRTTPAALCSVRSIRAPSSNAAYSSILAPSSDARSP